MNTSEQISPVYTLETNTEGFQTTNLTLNRFTAQRNTAAAAAEASAAPPVDIASLSSDVGDIIQNTSIMKDASGNLINQVCFACINKSYSEVYKTCISKCSLPTGNRELCANCFDTNLAKVVHNLCQTDCDKPSLDVIYKAQTMELNPSLVRSTALASKIAGDKAAVTAYTSKVANMNTNTSGQAEKEKNEKLDAELKAKIKEINDGNANTKKKSDEEVGLSKSSLEKAFNKYMEDRSKAATAALDDFRKGLQQATAALNMLEAIVKFIF